MWDSSHRRGHLEAVRPDDAGGRHLGPARLAHLATDPSSTGVGSSCGEMAAVWGWPGVHLGRTRRNSKYVKKSRRNPLRGWASGPHRTLLTTSRKGGRDGSETRVRTAGTGSPRERRSRRVMRRLGPESRSASIGSITSTGHPKGPCELIPHEGPSPISERAGPGPRVGPATRVRRSGLAQVLWVWLQTQNTAPHGQVSGCPHATSTVVRTRSRPTAPTAPVTRQATTKGDCPLPARSGPAYRAAGRREPLHHLEAADVVRGHRRRGRGGDECARTR